MERKTGNNRIAMWCFTKCFPTVECQKPLTSNANICSKNPERSFRKLQPFWFVHKKMNAAWPDGPWPQLKIEFTCENKGRNTQCDPRLAPVVQTHPLNDQDAAENQTVLYNSFLQNIATFLFQVMMRFPVKRWWVNTWTSSLSQHKWKASISESKFRGAEAAQRPGTVGDTHTHSVQIQLKLLWNTQKHALINTILLEVFITLPQLQLNSSWKLNIFCLGRVSDRESVAHQLHPPLSL